MEIQMQHTTSQINTTTHTSKLVPVVFKLHCALQATSILNHPHFHLLKSMREIITSSFIIKCVITFIFIIQSTGVFLSRALLFFILNYFIQLKMSKWACALRLQSWQEAQSPTQGPQRFTAIWPSSQALLLSAIRM